MADDIWKPLVWEKKHCKYASIIINPNGTVYGYISDAPDIISHKEAVRFYREKRVRCKYTVRDYSFGVYGNLTVEQKYRTAESFLVRNLGLVIV